ncbi:MAG: FAD-binding oxidoreductase [Candidatus Sumerlaeaceae bacterium]
MSLLPQIKDLHETPAQHASDLKLAPRYLAKVEGWGGAVHSISYQYQPTTVDGIREVFDLARRTGRHVALRGGGNSYGDASILQEGVVLDRAKMDRVLVWNPETGRITLEPGVTIQKLWRTIIADGWWPPVVSGTMYTTAGGCAAMNIHGKNNYKVGPYGDHIVEFELLLPTGELRRVTRTSDPDLFYGAISGFGMLGSFTSITLQMKKVYSGLVSVEALGTANLAEMVEEFEERVDRMDYLVGWVDCVAGGRALGRGIVHAAHYLAQGVDQRPADTLNLAAQELPTKMLGMMPKSMLHYFMTPFINNLGVRLINAAKIWSGHLQPRSWVHYQSHGGFAFLLDYVPNWKLAYGKGGLIQYQSFIPKQNAVAAFEEMLRVSQRAGLPSYLGVFKKHREDDFLLTHALDGYSMAMDFRVTSANRERVWQMTRKLDQIVLDTGGRFYFAKDATLTPDVMRRFFGDETLEKFAALKRRCDPENLLQTDLSRRLFGRERR